MRKQRVVRLVYRVIIGVAWDQTNVSQLLTVPIKIGNVELEIHVQTADEGEIFYESNDLVVHRNFQLSHLRWPLSPPLVGPMVCRPLSAG